MRNANATAQHDRIARANLPRGKLPTPAAAPIREQEVESLRSNQALLLPVVRRKWNRSTQPAQELNPFPKRQPAKDAQLGKAPAVVEFDRCRCRYDLTAEAIAEGKGGGVLQYGAAFGEEEPKLEWKRSAPGSDRGCPRPVLSVPGAEQPAIEDTVQAIQLCPVESVPDTAAEFHSRLRCAPCSKEESQCNRPSPCGCVAHPPYSSAWNLWCGL
jgi:hypothetical protein